MRRTEMTFRLGSALDLSRCVVALGCVVVLGCKVGPDYERPPVTPPAAFRGSEAANAAAQESIANVPWWELFKDAQLRDLIKVALEQNRDLKIAIERIEEA